MLKRILLALDSSDSGQVAISFTIALAGSDTEVRILHVNEFLVGGRGLTMETPAEARFLLDDAVLQLRCCGVTPAGLTATGVVAIATCFSVADCIIAEADRWSADAIVLGSARRRGLRRIACHGVRERVIRSSCLPVLTAPAPLRVASAELVPAAAAAAADRRGPISRLHH
jgi:nucleotide-binding universal stress UspA family protein